MVFPDAQLKFYLDATPAERARSRRQAASRRGEVVDMLQLQQEIVERDARDARRAVGPLIAARRRRDHRHHPSVHRAGRSAHRLQSTQSEAVLNPVPQRSLLWKTLQMPSRFLTTLLFDLKTYGRHNVPEKGGVLLVANHQSNLDPILVAVHLSRPVCYLAKSELFVNPCFRWLIESLHAFPVRQGQGDIGAMKETIRKLHEGNIVNVYPEGTRTEDGQIGPLEKGVALVIRRADVPVVPVAIDGSFEALPRETGAYPLLSHPDHVRPAGRPVAYETRADSAMDRP